MEQLIFIFLCGILYIIGISFGLSYETTSIYICVYLWTILCIISTFPILYNSIKRIKYNKIIGIIYLIFSVIYTYCYIYITYISIKRYGNINDSYSFDRCVIDLCNIAKYVGVTYEEINIYIYVYGFILIVGFNLLLSYIIKPKRLVRQPSL